MGTRSRLILLAIGALALVAPACSSATQDDGDTSEGALSEPGAGDLPWEVRSRTGETFLSNVFYAEASETEQIMPLMINGRLGIDRLIYPTLGNPNLYIKSDPHDEFMTVARVERELVDRLGASMDRAVGSSKFLRFVDLPDAAKNDRNNGFHFFLIQRPARYGATAIDGTVSACPGVYEIKPSTIYAHAITDDMPAPFKARYTLRFVFDRGAMADVPAGLYDVRMEIRKDGAIPPATTDSGNPGFEFQYNALRVFDQASDDFSVINVTDTQVSHSEPGRGPLPKTLMEHMTLAHLQEFVQRVNASTDPAVRDAPFVVFNGDLHNGGSPDALRPSRVAWTYNDEARVIVDTLKDLNFPIFLTAGNHDGYTSTGQPPAAIDEMLGHAVDWITGSEDGTLEQTVKNAVPKAWPGFDWNDYKRFLDATKNQPGGRHLDLHTGANRRLRGVSTSCDGDCFAKGWVPIDRSKRNYILYDGFNQWHHTYGPTYYSWTFGKSRFVSLNSYELRQHRRSGWGYYTVNYGGAMSQVQMEWLAKEIGRGETNKEDVVLLAHHDPRGGHKGKDYPYYFKPLEYRGIDQSAGNYVMGEVLDPKICNLVPGWAQTHDEVLTCLHDGLQEWMRADSEFDCDEGNRYRDARGTVDGICDEQSYSGPTHPWYSGYDLLDLVMLHPVVRTLVLGHTHYNSLEVLQTGQKIVPTTVTLDAETQQRHEAAETTNPIRAFSIFQDDNPGAAYDPNFVTPGLSVQNGNMVVDLAASGHAFANHVIQGDARELVILRLTSNADLTGQSYVGSQKRSGSGDTMYGFSTLRLYRRQDARGYGLPQINEVTFYLNEKDGSFEAVERKPIDRTTTIANAQTNPQNPFCQMFRGSGAEACK